LLPRTLLKPPAEQNMETIRYTLEQIQALQHTTEQVARLRHDREMLDVDVRNQRRLLEDTKRRAAQAHERRLELTRQADAAQISIQQAEQEIERLNTQLNMARHQKEYDAFQKSVLSHRADIQRWEDQCLTALQTVDELAAEEKRLAEEVAQAESRLAQVEADVVGQREALSEQIADLDARAEHVRSKIAPGVLTAYDRIAGRKQPLATVKNRVCQGCFTQITKQSENLLMRGQEIVYCSSCGRMLVLEDAV
jgi:predicted  nucleic acid-binding Zn-ribbon protein